MKFFTSRILRIISIPTVLAGLLALVGLTVGWNLITLLIFWFLVIPILALQIPRMLSSRGNQLFESALGLTIFYAIIVFMIYEHYQTDYFQVMMISFFVNLLMIIVKSRRRLFHPTKVNA
jgi:hypothetical protein